MACRELDLDHVSRRNVEQSGKRRKRELEGSLLSSRRSCPCSSRGFLAYKMLQLLIAMSSRDFNHTSALSPIRSIVWYVFQIFRQYVDEEAF